MERCTKQQSTKISFSWRDHLKFADHNMKRDIQIRVCADFECFNQPQNDHKVLYKQVPSAVGFYLIAPFGNQYYSCFGEGCVIWLVNGNLTLEKTFYNYLKTNISLQITPQEEVQFQQSDVCWLCERLISQNIDKVRENDHLTGHYRGAAQNK